METYFTKNYIPHSYMFDVLWFKFSSLIQTCYSAFHDCVGPNGCDGCLNIDDPSNAGLSEIVDRLATVREGSRRVPEFTVRMMTRC